MVDVDHDGLLGIERRTVVAPVLHDEAGAGPTAADQLTLTRRARRAALAGRSAVPMMPGELLDDADGLAPPLDVVGSVAGAAPQARAVRASHSRKPKLALRDCNSRLGNRIGG
jgi:hypothetical protein